MQKRDIELLRQEIQIKNIYLKQMRRWLLIGALIMICGALIAYWGFSGMNDPFIPNVNVASRQPFAWLFSLLAGGSAIFALLIVIGMVNGRKHILTLIEELDQITHGKNKK